MKILPTAIALALLGGVIGLICGVLYSVGGFFVDLFTIGLNWGTLMAFGALIAMPVIFAAVGFACGVLLAIVVGGIRAVLGGRRR